MRQMMHRYVRWAMRYPARFKLTFGSWSTDSAELAEAATAARSTLVEAVETAQAAKALPEGDPERVAALILAVAHGAVDLALSGHLSTTGRAMPAQRISSMTCSATYTTPGNGSSELWSLSPGRSALRARSDIACQTVRSANCSA